MKAGEHQGRRRVTTPSNDQAPTGGHGRGKPERRLLKRANRSDGALPRPPQKTPQQAERQAW